MTLPPSPPPSRGGDPLTAALRFLKVRLRSAREVLEKLLKNGTGEAEAEKVLAQLRVQGILDDARFAHWWAEDRALSGKYGPLRVRDELEAKGVSLDLVEAALEKAFPPERTREILASLTAKARSRGRNPAGLVAKGFDPDQVEEMLARDATL